MKNGGAGPGLTRFRGESFCLRVSHVSIINTIIIIIINTKPFHHQLYLGSEHAGTAAWNEKNAINASRTKP